MSVTATYSRKDRLRNYSAIFSRRVFKDIIELGDFTYIDTIVKRYDYKKIDAKDTTYVQYLKYIYKVLSKEYKCEYLYKNTIINELLIKTHGTKDTIAINEFRVRNSIVDIALFNGVSRAFEIKTELDNDKRLHSQLEDYTKLFQECYVVVPEQLETKYIESLDVRIGIDVLYVERGKLKIKTIRKALFNENIDVDILIRSLRTNEYKNIIKNKFGELPNVSCFDMFDKCLEKMSEIPDADLHRLFLAEIKKRNTNTQNLLEYTDELRQICLSLNINAKDYDSLQLKLNNTIYL